MPYIKQEDMDRLHQNYSKRSIGYLKTPGELNYLITNLCLDYLDTNSKNYETLNSIVGVLECTKQEFYRRIVSPYEDEKIKQNGDVY